MKKAALLTLVVLLMSSASFAQQPALAKKEKTNPMAIQKAVNGVIASVVVANPVKGVRAQIVLTDENGKAVNFRAASAVMIHDSEMKMLSLDKLAKGDKVQIKYLALPAGDLEALSIKIVK